MQALRGSVVLAGEAAEDQFPADPVLGKVDRRRPVADLRGRQLAERAMRSAGVVVPQVFSQSLAQVMFVQNQEPVEQLAAQGADHPLADRVRLRGLRRAEEHPDACGGEDGVEGIGELPSAVPDQVPGSVVGFLNSATYDDLGFMRPARIR